MASFFDKPIISWVATDSDFKDKTEAYTTLSRTLGPFYKMGFVLVEVFAEYDWE